MPRQPLPRKYHAPDWDMGPQAFSKRPKHAAIIGRCLAMWSSAELQMAILLSVLLKAEDTDAAIAVYMVLRRSTPRYEAITVAGNFTLDQRDREVLGAVLHIYQTAEAERNALAHGCFGIHQSMPNSVLWAEPTSMAHYVVEMLRHESIVGALPPLEEHRIFAKKISHYTDKALEAIFDQINIARRVVFDLIVYLRTASDKHVNQHGRDLLYDQLCNSAPIRKALLVLRELASRNKPKAPLRQRLRRRRARI
jgi:hypothetical protein